MKQSVLSITTPSGEVKNIAFTPPVKLSSLFAQNGISVEMPCGGRQKCLKCKVKVTGSLSPISQRESSLLTNKEKNEGIRYACMTNALGDVHARLLSGGLYEDNILTQGYLPKFEPLPWGKHFGIAFDVGTTTVAAYLYQLSNQRHIKNLADKNPQSAFGADVISRLQKSVEGQSQELATSIRGCLAGLINELCKLTSTPLEKVDSIVITGNTAMLYLLLRMNPESIVAAPFTQDCYFGMFVTGRQLELPCDARVYLPRCISAYVGADITTALLAAEFVKNGKVVSGGPKLLVDIGTNGEMALAADGKLLCCSTAAGPAFEGAGIYRGIPARTGAIYKVSFENELIECSVLGQGKALGICGSGLLDAVAVMCNAGIIGQTGSVCQDGHGFTQYITEVDNKPAFRLPGTQIILTQQDIRAVQLAKSAICAGMLTLIKESGYSPDDIEELVIAGGFGSHINVISAQRIGLIPPDFANRSHAIGNAAGSGAVMVLLSDTIRRQSEQIGNLTTTVELSTNPYFMDNYINGMMFP